MSTETELQNKFTELHKEIFYLRAHNTRLREEAFDSGVEMETLREALVLIRDVVHTPTKATTHKTAERHFMADFDQIRRIIESALKGDSK
jgi:regulator of replication initiation timing